MTVARACTLCQCYLWPTEFAETPQNIFIGRINGRLRRPSVRPQKMRTGRIFQQSVRHFFFFFLGGRGRHYSLAFFLSFFRDCQLLIARPIVAIAVGKAAIFHSGLE